jgi:hypothetical protein
MRTLKALLLLLLAAPGLASAQASRTWVSGVGDDLNPCSRTAPCKTFPGTISKTAAGGEINCLDPGGFGAVTITKSISIRCDYTEGGILGASTNGIVVNPSGGNVDVYLSGLDLEGYGNGATPGLNGIRWVNGGGSLTVENCTIRNFKSSAGIQFNPSAAARLHVNNTLLQNNGGASTGGGITITPVGAATVGVTLDNVRVIGNTQGVQVEANATSGGISVAITRSEISHSALSGVIAHTGNPTFGPASIDITHTTIASNKFGVSHSGGVQAVVNIGSSLITGNATAISGAVGSFGNNQVIDNAAPGTALTPVGLQ